MARSVRLTIGRTMSFKKPIFGSVKVEATIEDDMRDEDAGSRKRQRARVAAEARRLLHEQLDAEMADLKIGPEKLEGHREVRWLGNR